MKKCDFLKTLQWPDFEIFFGDQGHKELKNGFNGSSRTFFFSGGLLRPVVHLHNNMLSQGLNKANNLTDPLSEAGTVYMVGVSR